MKVREERGLANCKLAKSGGQGALGPGPYALAEDAKPHLGKVLQGYRCFALLMVRAPTYGT